MIKTIENKGQRGEKVERGGENAHDRRDCVVGERTEAACIAPTVCMRWKSSPPRTGSKSMYTELSSRSTEMRLPTGESGS